MLVNPGFWDLFSFISALTLLVHAYQPLGLEHHLYADISQPLSYASL